MIVVRASTSYSFTTVAAVSSWRVSMRMSSGASAMYENPRDARSICGLLTPRSNRTPMTFPSSSSLATIVARS